MATNTDIRNCLVDLETMTDGAKTSVPKELARMTDTFKTFVSELIDAAKDSPELNANDALSALVYHGSKVEKLLGAMSPIYQMAFAYGLLSLIDGLGQSVGYTIKDPNEDDDLS